MEPSAGWTSIYIYPGYRFKVMDALVTNFHLPQSTLIMLVSALAGREHVLHAYEEAVKENTVSSASACNVHFLRRVLCSKSSNMKARPDAQIQMRARRGSADAGFYERRHAGGH